MSPNVFFNTNFWFLAFFLLFFLALVATALLSSVTSVTVGFEGIV